MNLFLRELRANRKSMIIWSAAMIFLIITGMAKYSAAVDAGGGGLNDIIMQMPKALQRLFGAGAFDFNNILDYFAVLYLYIALMGGIHAAMLGTGIISKEERDKTAEFLMVKPISRTKVVSCKLLAALLCSIIFNLVTAVSSYVTMSYYAGNTESFANGLMKLMFGMLAIQWIFLVTGSFFASVIKKPKFAMAIASYSVLLMFMLSAFADISDSAEFLRYFTVFKYFDAKDLLKDSWSAIYAGISFALILALLTGTYKTYTKRDIKN